MGVGRDSIRSQVARFTVATVLLALVAAAALAFVTTSQRRQTDMIASSVDSIRLTQVVQQQLLRHLRTGDPNARVQLERDIHRNLGFARTHVATTGEARALDTAESSIADYLRAAHAAATPRNLDAGYRAAAQALDSLIDVNVAQAAGARVRARALDRWSNVIGGMVAVAVVASALGTAWGLQRAFEPVEALSDTMARFGAGESRIRADAHGARELKEMAEGFNQMAGSIVARHENHMAFVAGVAHDVRNTLTATALTLGTIPRRFLREPAVGEPLATVRHQLRTLNRLIGDLMDRAAIEADQLVLTFHDHDLRTIVRAAVEPYTSAATLHPIVTHLPDQPVVVHCDAVRIEQVTSNLIANAVKYSPPGSPIEVTLTDGNGGAILTVRDHGVGIAPADQPRIFDRYVRVGPARERVRGVGLGLFGVRRIVEAHGGRIDVDSTPGKGAQFAVQLGTRSTIATP